MINNFCEKKYKALRFALIGLVGLFPIGLGLSGCETISVKEPRYPIYMQGKPAPAAEETVANQDEASQDEPQTTQAPSTGSVSTSDLPPPPPPPPPPSKAEVVVENEAAFIYVMQAHDTLYGVSRRFGVSIQTLYIMNALTANSPINVGKKILLPSTAKDRGVEERANGAGLQALPKAKPSQVATTPMPEKMPEKPTEKPVVKTFPNAQALAQKGKGRFVWPTKGAVLVRFGQLAPNVRNDGINISAVEGANVVASADGVVVYVGGQVKELGNTIYIQNGNGWYTGYSHLATMSVKTNQKVVQGQPIGTVGKTGAVDRSQLHFEVRYTPSSEIAKPIDPILVLP